MNRLSAHLLAIWCNPCTSGCSGKGTRPGTAAGKARFSSRSSVFRPDRCRWHSTCHHLRWMRNSRKADLIIFMNAVLPAGRLAGRPPNPGTPEVRRTFEVNLEHGLHARPCAMLVKAVRPYNVTIDVEANGEKASGKSILGLMALAAGSGTRITFTIIGEKAYRDGGRGRLSTRLRRA